MPLCPQSTHLGRCSIALNGGFRSSWQLSPTARPELNSSRYTGRGRAWLRARPRLPCGAPGRREAPVPPIPTRSSGAWQVRFCITAELGERLRPEPHLRLRYSCSPYHQNSALFRFIGELGRAARFGSGDEPAAS